MEGRSILLHLSTWFYPYYSKQNAASGTRKKILSTPQVVSSPKKVLFYCTLII